MIVTCPQCSKRYMLDDALIPKEGRQVRCIACSHVWRQVPDMTYLKKNPFPLEIRGEYFEAPSLSERKSSWVRWGLFCMLIFILVSFIILGRNFVVSLWPQSERYYELAGLQVSVRGSGLVIANATSLTQREGLLERIVVGGDIINTSHQVRSIPPLRIHVMGESSNLNCLEKTSNSSCILESWEHKLSESSLLPGEQIHFETVPRPKVEGIQHIDIEF